MNDARQQNTANVNDHENQRDIGESLMQFFPKFSCPILPAAAPSFPLVLVVADPQKHWRFRGTRR